MSRMRVFFIAVVVAAVGAGSASAKTSIADARCADAIARQVAKGIVGHGGDKRGVVGPANCDHYFNS